VLVIAVKSWKLPESLNLAGK